MSRLVALRALMAERDIAAMWVSSLVNVRYVSGFTGSNGALLIPRDDSPVMLTDGRYQDQARAELAELVPDARYVITRDLTGEAKKLGVSHAETHHISVDDWRSLGEPQASGPLVEQLRVVKDSVEIDHLRRACDISVEALEGLLAGPLAGRSERELARELEHRMVECGAEAVAFETILAAGENTAIPHHRPTDRLVREGDLVKIDFGARVAGYHADCTRTVVIGAADRWQREVYAVVKAAQQAGVDALMPGTALNAVHAAACEVLTDAGWLDHFTTGLGHGVGLEIHEDPYFSAGGTARLRSRTVLTMEPGIYVPGRGGVRIEDTVLVPESPDSASEHESPDSASEHESPDSASEHAAPAPQLLTTTSKELLEIT